jgi:hypothetical protein
VLYESGADADCRRRFPYPTLLVAHDEDRQSDSPVTRETSAEIGVKLGAVGEWFVLPILAEVSPADYSRPRFATSLSAVLCNHFR